jgi:hypothetical protein
MTLQRFFKTRRYKNLFMSEGNENSIHVASLLPQEAKYLERWPSTTSAWAGWSRLIFLWIGMLEYMPCYGASAEHWGPLPATRLASRKILIEQHIKNRTGPALCVLCAPPHTRAAVQAQCTVHSSTGGWGGGWGVGGRPSELSRPALPV